MYVKPVNVSVGKPLIRHLYRSVLTQKPSELFLSSPPVQCTLDLVNRFYQNIELGTNTRTQSCHLSHTCFIKSHYQLFVRTHWLCKYRLTLLKLSKDLSFFGHPVDHVTDPRFLFQFSILNKTLES